MNPDARIIDEWFQRFRMDLAECADIAPEKLGRETRLTDVVPPSRRRAVWNRLAERGYCLPALTLEWWLPLVLAPSVLLSSLALAACFHHPAFFATIFPLSWLAWRLTRPLAVHVPAGCETVYEAALQITPFRRQDFDSGRWSEADTSAKVRAIVALQLGLSLDKVKPESNVVHLSDG